MQYRRSSILLRSFAAATFLFVVVARRLAGQEELPGPEHGGALPESYPGRGNQGCESLILSFSILAHNATTLARLAALREVAGRAEVAVAGAARDLLRHGGVYQPRLRVEILEIDLSPGTHAVARAQVDVMSSEHVWTLMGLLTGRAPGISSVSRLDVVLRAQGVDAQQLLSNPAKLQRFQGDARQGLLDVVQRVSGLHASASAWTELKGLVGTGPGLADVLSTINFLGSSDGEAAVKALRGSLQDGPLKVQMGNGAMAMLSLAPGSPQAHEDRSSSLLKESMGVVSGNAEAIGLGEVSHGAAECHADDHRPPGRALLDNRELVHSRTTRQRTAFGGQYGLDSDPSALASSSLTPEHGVKYNHLHRYGGESSVESYYGSSSEYSSSADRPGSSSGQDRSSAGISSALISSAQLSSESSSTSGGQSYGSSLPFGDSSSQQAASASPVRKGRGQISNQSGGSSSPDKSNARKLPGSSDGPSEPTESERTPSSTARRLPSSSSQDSSAQKQKPNDAAKAPDVAMGSETSGGSSSSSQQRIRPGHSIPVEVTESSYGLSSQDTTSSSTHHANQPVAMIPPQTPRTPTPLATNTNPGRPEVKAAPESTDPRWNSSPGAHQAGDSSGTSSASMPVTHGMSEPQQPIASPGAPSPLSTVGIPNETPTPTTAPSAPTLAAGGSSEALDPLPEAATTSPSRPVPRMTADGVSDSSQSHVAPSMSSTPVINMATPILSTIPVTSSEALDPSSGGAPTPSTLMYPLPRETTEGTAEWSHSHTTPTAYLPIKTVAPPPTGEPRPNDFDALSETSAIAPSLTQTATRQVIEDESDSSQSHSVPELHTPIITIPVPFPTRAASSSSDASANPSHAATASPVLPPVATAHLPGPAWTVASPGSTPRPEEAAPTGAIPVEPAPAVTPRITGLTSGPSPTLLPTPPGSLMEPSTIPDTTPQTTSDAVPGNTLQPSEQFPAATPFLTSIPTPDVDPVPTGEPPGPDVAPQATGKTTPPPTGQTTQPSSTPQSIVPSPTASPVGTAPSLSAQPMRSVFFISDFTGRDVNQLAEDPLQLQELEALYIDSFRRIPGLLGLNTPEAVKLLQITLDVGVVPSIYTEVRFGQERDAQEFARVLQTLEGAGSNELGFGSVELRNVFTGAPGQGDNPPPAAQPSEVSATGDGQQQNVRAPAPGVDAAAVVGFFGALSTRCVMDCRGQCCAAPGRLDARLECCQDRVDECGVCAGDATSCAIGGNITVAMKQQGLSADRVGTGVKHGLVNAFADFHLDPMESIEVEHVSNRGALYKGKEVVSVLFVITPGGDGNPLVSVPSLAEFAQRLTDGGKRKEDWRSVTILAFEGATRKGVFGNGVCEIGEVELGCPDCPQMMACPRSTHVEVGQAGIPCSGQGFCAGATGRCLCDRGYSGVSCEVCAAGYRAARGSCRPEESATEERGPGVPPGGFTGATGAAQGGWQGGERSQGGDQAPEERNLNVLAIAVLGGAVGVLVGAVSAAIACRCWVLHHGQRPANIELGYDGLENRPRCGPASKAAELTGGWGALRTERPGAHHGMETSVVSSHISHPKQGAASASPHPGRIQEARLAGQLYVRHGRGRGVFARPSQAPSAAHSRSRFDHLWGRAQAIETPLAAENSSNQSPATASSLRRPAACHKAEDWRSPARQVGGGTPSASLDSLDHECSRETSPGCPARVHSCSVGPELERLWSTPQVGQPRDFKDTQAQTMPSRIQSDVSTMTDTDHVRGAGVVVTNRQVEKHEGCGQRVDHGLGQPAANIRIGQTWRDGDLVIETATPGGHQQLLSISVSLHHHTHLAGWQDDAEAGVGRHPGVIQQGAGGVAEEDGAVAARTGRRQQPRNTRGTNGR